MVDEFVTVTDREAIDTMRRVAAEDGLLIGGSGGLAVAAALKLASRVPPQSVIVVIVPDSGRNYLTKYHNDDWLARWGFADHPPVSTRYPHAREYHGVPSDVTLGEARALAHGQPVVPVHIRRGGSTVVAAEIVGTLDLRATGALPSDAPVRCHLAAAPTRAGIGEPVAVVRERARRDGSALVILVRDGEAAAIVAVSDGE